MERVGPVTLGVEIGLGGCDLFGLSGETKPLINNESNTVLDISNLIFSLVVTSLLTTSRLFIFRNFITAYTLGVRKS
ncbi:MAG: hypothetical protein QG639_171 [Patescibacteria group bacterium]|nr:hypothetical protein [Patescibacteria group bacterium]